MRLASCDSWLLLLVSTMLGKRCSSLREGGGGVWEALAERDLGVRAVRGQPSSPAPSADEAEQGTTEMEMERPWPPPCRGGLPELRKETLGEKTSLSCWVSGRRSFTSPAGLTSSPCQSAFVSMYFCYFFSFNISFFKI